MTVPFGSQVRDPREWMREQEQRTAALLAKAEQAKAELEQNVVTVSSPDRLVTVTVNPGGGLTSLTLSPQAQEKPSAQLASLIMSTYRKATARAGERTLAIMAELTGGEDSEAVEFVKSTLPPQEEPRPDPEAEEDARFAVDDPEPSPPTPPAPPAPKPRPRRPEPDEHEGDDFQHINWTDRA